MLFLYGNFRFSSIYRWSIIIDFASVVLTFFCEKESDKEIIKGKNKGFSLLKSLFLIVIVFVNVLLTVYAAVPGL